MSCLDLNRFVTTTRVDADSRRSRPSLIRSYDHRSFDDSSPNRTNTDISSNTNEIQERRQLRRRIYEKAPSFEVWQVARAATAMPFYFEPIKIENGQGASSRLLTGSKVLNPTRIGTQEIGDLYGYNSVGIVVSVGTAHTMKPNAKKTTFFSTFPESVRESSAELQQVQENIENDHEESQYFRLDDTKGLEIKFDEWEPKGNLISNKKVGSKTIIDMNDAFAKYMANADTQKQFRDCAAALVARRRKRMATRKWERYATGSSFECRLRGCGTEGFLDRDEFVCHLSEFHGLEDSDLVDMVRKTRRDWQYQAAALKT